MDFAYATPAQKDISREQTAREVQEDLDVMSACVARRLGSYPRVEHLSQWPAGMGASRLSHGHLLLSQSPNWDVAAASVGRWARRAHIAELLARQSLIEASNLRQTPGYLWLSQGVAGAVGSGRSVASVTACWFAAVITARCDSSVMRMVRGLLVVMVGSP